MTEDRQTESSANMSGVRVQAAAVVLLVCMQAVAANVREDNFGARHLLHSEHSRYFESLAAVPAEGDEEGVWHYNDARAPLVNKDSIGKARQMELEDDAAADEVKKLSNMYTSMHG